MPGCDDYNDESIVSIFDSACFSFGDQDAVQVYGSSSSGDDNGDGSSSEPIGYSYVELQEYSKDVAAQLFHRFRPSYVLVDCLGHVAAETVSILACMRLGIEFVPVSATDDSIVTSGDSDASDLDSPGEMRIVAIVKELRKHVQNRQHPNIVAIVCCENDRDPILGVFAKAQVHQILFVDKAGNLRERLAVREDLPPVVQSKADNLYVLFTSGTTSTTKLPKAVVGSHKSTLRRLEWFRDTFPPSQRIGRRTKLTFVDGVTELLGGILFPQYSSSSSSHQGIVAFEPEVLQHEGIGAFLDAGVTQLTLLPSQLAQLLLLPKERFSNLDRVIVSGEPCPAALLGNFKEHLPHATLINLYGQTETTGDVLCAVLTDMGDAAVVNGVVAVGKPILPSISITCQNQNELVVHGNLSNGYLNSNAPMASFASGDIGFCHNDVWYIQGRTNNACKVSGVWTFPTEIESAFAKFYDLNCGAVAATILEDQIYVLTDQPVPTFSRERMRDAGLPWNLIPKQVVVHNSTTLPNSASGAAKLDRSAVKEIVQSIIQGTTRTGDDILESLVRDVLRLTRKDEIDMTKSFVELGGDSASAVTFLYHLRRRFDTKNLHAVDILRSESLGELRAAIMDGVPLRKRQRHLDHQGTQSPPPFQPHDIIQCSSEKHQAIQFQACVDAPPLIHPLGNMLFAACQGGVVQRMKLIDSNSVVVAACRHFNGWMIQAGLIIVSDNDNDVESLIVCCYTRENASMVTSLSLDLQVIRWQQHFDGGKITSTPIVKDDHLWINFGHNVVSISLKCGTRSRIHCLLPFRSATRPILHNSMLLYASCDYDTGLMTVDMQGGSCNVHFSDVLGPVYKNSTQLSDGTLLLTDSYGSIHRVNLDDKTILTQSVSHYNKPLTCACVVQDRVVVVGSYDSIVYGLNPSDWTMLWQLNAQAAIYAAPVRITNAYVLVCTTAGDIIQVDVNNGKQIWKTRIGGGGEIWSDPVQLDDTLVAFGARDSRLHLVTIGKSPQPS